MIRSFLHILLSLQLLVSTAGIGLFVHVCENDGVLISFFTQPQCSCAESEESCSLDATCCAQGNEKSDCDSSKSDCCSDFFELLKAETDFPRIQIAVQSDSEQEFMVSDAAAFGFANSLPCVDQKIPFNSLKAPPSGEKLWLLHEAILC